MCRPRALLLALLPVTSAPSLSPPPWGILDAMDRTLGIHTADALQSLVEAAQEIARDLPAERRTKVDQLLHRVRQAKAAIMAELA